MITQIGSENEKIMLASEICAQKNYVTEAKEKYEATKAFRHDFGNHIIALRGLLDKMEFEKASSYLDRLQKIHEDISFFVNTGNTTLDILLGEKLSYANKLALVVKCDILVPTIEKIDDFDLCALFSNALDNAIRGRSRLKDGEKTIHIIAKPAGEFFIIDMVNNYRAGNVRKGNGIGLATIRIIADKYHGAVEIENDNSTFRIIAILPFDAE